MTDLAKIAEIAALTQVDIDALWLGCNITINPLWHSRNAGRAQLRLQRLVSAGVVSFSPGMERPLLANHIKEQSNG